MLITNNVTPIKPLWALYPVHPRERDRAESLWDFTEIICSFQELRSLNTTIMPTQLVGTSQIPTGIQWTEILSES